MNKFKVHLSINESSVSFNDDDPSRIKQLIAKYVTIWTQRTIIDLTPSDYRFK